MSKNRRMLLPLDQAQLEHIMEIDKSDLYLIHLLVDAHYRPFSDVNLIIQSREFAFPTHILMQNNAKSHMPWKILQCWEMSRNAGYMPPKSQGTKHRTIRARCSGSHGSKSPQDRCNRLRIGMMHLQLT